MNRWERELAYHGLDLGPILGQGRFSEVYETSHPRIVAKFTRDESDASLLSTAIKLQQNGRAQRLVKVYGVRRTQRHTWLVLAERGVPIQDNESKAFYANGWTFDDPYESIRSPYTWMREWYDYQRRRSPWMALAIDLRGIIETLADLQVDTITDLRPSNFVMVDGQMKICDLGCSSSPHVAPLMPSERVWRL